MKAKRKTKEQARHIDGENGNGISALIKELWEAAVTLRGSIEPADYKRYVLPIIFQRFLSMRYEKRREELEKLIADEIQRRQKKNLAKAKSFRALLEETLRRYHNRLIDAAKVIKAMIEIRRDMERQTRVPLRSVSTMKNWRFTNQSQPITSRFTGRSCCVTLSTRSC